MRLDGRLCQRQALGELAVGPAQSDGNEGLPLAVVQGVQTDWRRDFTDEQCQQWTHRLANVVLLNRTKNFYVQNYDFADKKIKYFTGKHGVSTFALTSQVLHHQQWTPQLLHKRQQRLLSLLADEWDL